MGGSRSRAGTRGSLTHQGHIAIPNQVCGSPNAHAHSDALLSLFLDFEGAMSKTAITLKSWCGESGSPHPTFFIFFKTYFY